VITAVTTQQFVQKHSQQHLLTWSESLLHTFDVAQWNCTDTQRSDKARLQCENDACSDQY